MEPRPVTPTPRQIDAEARAHGVSPDLLLSLDSCPSPGLPDDVAVRIADPDTDDRETLRDGFRRLRCEQEALGRDRRKLRNGWVALIAFSAAVTLFLMVVGNYVLWLQSGRSR